MPRGLDVPPQLPFGRGNYFRLGISLLFMVVGFVVMSLESAPYGQGFLGLTLGPLLVLLGFALVFWAIFYNANSGQKQDKRP